MNQQLEALKNCTDADDLKPMLHAICTGFGEVARLDVLIASQVGKRQALCFLRMATLEQEQNLIRELQVGRFGDDVVLIVDLDRKAVDAYKIHGVNSQSEIEDPIVRRHFQPTLPMASSSTTPCVPWPSPATQQKAQLSPPATRLERDVWYG